MLKNFYSIIYPFTLEEFKNQYFSQKAAKFTEKAENRELIFSWQKFNSLLNTKKLPFSKISLSIKGQHLPEIKDSFTLMKYANNGAKINIRDIHYHNTEINELCANIASQLNSRVSASIWAAPAENSNKIIQSFLSDIFIIQLEGQINFAVGPEREKYNQQEKNFYLFESLKASEILYIPANHIFIQEEKSASLSLVISLEYPSEMDFLAWYINNELINDPEFNSPFLLTMKESSDPSYKKKEIPIQWQEKAEDLKKAFLNKINDQSLIDKYYDFLVKSQQGFSYYNFPYPFKEETFQDLKSTNFIRPEYQDTVIEKDENQIKVYFWNQSITYDSKYENLIRYIFTNTKIKGKELLNFEKTERKELKEIINDLVRRGIISLENE